MTLAELQQLLTAADPAAVLVSPRVLDRVIQEVCQLPGLAWAVPHRDCFVVDRHILFRYVEQDDLILESHQLLPPTVILLARPSAEDLSAAEPGPALLKFWRLLFHANIHHVLQERWEQALLNEDIIRERIIQIGRTEIEEIRAVLFQDQYLTRSADDRQVYIEFAAVFLELRYFAPTLLEVNFPALRDQEGVHRLLCQDLDAAALFQRTRLARAPEPGPPPPDSSLELHEYYWKLVRSADRAAKGGNRVKAAIIRTRAARVAPAALTPGTRAAADADLKQLTQRLQEPLQLSDAQAEELLGDLKKLLDKADQGRHPVEAALLYDLQQVCLDHEREIYSLDIVEWALSLGKRPIKRPLPSQRMVRIIRHVRSALQRLTISRLSEADRAHLTGFLQAALHGAEERLRDRVRPVLVAVIEDVGLTPSNPPERTAFFKMVEEFLDRIIDSGFVTFGDLRDTISRNQLKMPDLANPQDFIRGDPLLRLDRRLATLLDGVYRHSEIYMRWLERATALGFGTKVGRMFSNFLLIPFGAAFILLESLYFLIHHFAHRFQGPTLETVAAAPPASTISSIGLMADPVQGPFLAASAQIAREELAVRSQTGGSLIVWSFSGAFSHPDFWNIFPLALWLLAGIFFLGCFRSETFRGRCKSLAKASGRGLKIAFVDWPLTAVSLPRLQQFLGSWPVQLAYWYLLKPGLICALLWLFFGQFFPGTLSVVALFLAINIVINSHTGLVLGEGMLQGAIDLVQMIRSGLLVSMFNFLVALFKQITHFVEFLLFKVDEGLRFRKGDSEFSLFLRGLLSTLWFPVAFLLRFYWIVLIEPVVNPIKIPICIVAGKLFLPFYDPVQQIFSAILSPVLGPYMGYSIAWVTVFFLPDLCGFLIWEFKENRSLYRANRPKHLKPVRIGQHGETMRGLLQPGFHSGTVPHLFERLRRAERLAPRLGNWRTLRSFRQSLEEVKTAVRKFVTREMLALLQQSSLWAGQPLTVGEVKLATNRIEVELKHDRFAGEAVRLRFESHARWLTAGLSDTGWLKGLPSEQGGVFLAGLSYLYRVAGIDLVHEQIRTALPEQAAVYEIRAAGLLVWLDAQHQQSVYYSFHHNNGMLLPQRPNGESNLEWPLLEPRRLVFGRSKLSWRQLVGAWIQTDLGMGENQLVNAGLNLAGEQPLIPLPATNHAPYNKLAVAEPAAAQETEPTKSA